VALSQSDCYGGTVQHAISHVSGNMYFKVSDETKRVMMQLWRQTTGHSMSMQLTLGTLWFYPVWRWVIPLLS